MRKYITLLLVLTVLAVTSSLAFADTNPTDVMQPARIWGNTSPIQLNDTQKEELSSLYSKMLEIRKQMVQKYVEYDLINPEEAQLMEENMDARFQDASESGQFFGRRGFGNRGFNGHGPCFNY